MAKRPNSRTGKHSTRLAPQMVDVLSRRLQVAEQAWAAGERQDALILFNDAVREEPNNVRAYVLAARAHAEQFEFEQMERIHEKLVRRAPRHPGVHHYIGETLGLLRLPVRAAASFAEAARLPGAGPPTWVELASLNEQAHRLDEAEELIERTLRAGYNSPTVALVRGRIARRQEKLEQAERSFQEIIDRSPGSAWACQAWGEIALLKDRAGECEAAVQAISECKRLQRAHEAPFWTIAHEVASQMREMVEQITRDDLTAWKQNAAQLETGRMALLTGFPRSGTTLLEQVLDAHPDLVSSEERDFIGRELVQTVISSRGKVPFLESLRDMRIDEIRRERQRYFGAMEYLLGEPIGGRVLLDKNPAYNLLVPLVLRVFPETRVIVALRDPRDVVLSCYLRYLPLNAVSVWFVDIRRAAERYALDMNAWLQFRELISAPWCEVRYEDMIASLELEARRALETLGLSWNDEVLGYRARLSTTKRVVSPTYEAVAEPIYTRAMGRWKNYERLLEPAMKTLEPFIREFGYSL